MAIQYVAEPFRIKSVEKIKILTREERIQKIKEAHYNLFYLRAEDVYIDLLTDSGTNAMSDEQWGAMMVADESYAGAKSYFKLEHAARDIFGFEYIHPVHQGRAAEKILLPILLEKKKIAISNMFFDTTRAHVNMTGSQAIDCVVEEARDLTNYYPFKGNMDIEKFQTLIHQIGKDQIGLVMMTITNNSAGGQPVSMENMRKVSRICKENDLFLCIDAARFAENAYLIKTRDEQYANWSIKEITRKFFSYADAFTMSAKKDAIVNMGGLIGVKCREDLCQKVKANTVTFEGFPTYGGLSGRDLEALAVGFYEGIDEDYLAYRYGQITYLASQLSDHHIPYQYPAGGHGIFIDAAAMFPTIPYNQFPGHALAIELYIEAGIRSCEVGSFMLGKDPQTLQQLEAEFEFTRLAVPRRVYTQAHIDVVAQALIAIQNRAAAIKGYEITWEPSILRHFQAKLRPL